jgi:hypothetical protein
MRGESFQGLGTLGEIVGCHQVPPELVAFDSRFLACWFFTPPDPGSRDGLVGSDE